MTYWLVGNDIQLVEVDEAVTAIHHGSAVSFELVFISHGVEERVRVRHGGGRETLLDNGVDNGGSMCERTHDDVLHVEEVVLRLDCDLSVILMPDVEPGLVSEAERALEEALAERIRSCAGPVRGGAGCSGSA